MRCQRNGLGHRGAEELWGLCVAGGRYLREIHMQALANVLRRPIILLKGHNALGDDESGIFLPSRHDPEVSFGGFGMIPSRQGVHVLSFKPHDRHSWRVGQACRLEGGGVRPPLMIYHEGNHYDALCPQLLEDYWEWAETLLGGDQECMAALRWGPWGRGCGVWRLVRRVECFCRHDLMRASLITVHYRHDYPHAITRAPPLPVRIALTAVVPHSRFVLGRAYDAVREDEDRTRMPWWAEEVFLLALLHATHAIEKALRRDGRELPGREHRREDTLSRRGLRNHYCPLASRHGACRPPQVICGAMTAC
jgi:hypothetical protein